MKQEPLYTLNEERDEVINKAFKSFNGFSMSIKRYESYVEPIKKQGLLSFTDRYFVW